MTVESKGMSYELCHHHRKSETGGGVKCKNKTCDYTRITPHSSKLFINTNATKI